MPSPCWSLLNLLSSSPTQHEAPPGQHDLLHDDTVHRAPLPEPIQSTSSADEPLPHVNYESDGNPRNTLSHILTKRASVGDSNDGVWPENSFPFRLFQFNFVFFEIVFFLSRLFFMYFLFVVYFLSMLSICSKQKKSSSFSLVSDSSICA